MAREARAKIKGADVVPEPSIESAAQYVVTTRGHRLSNELGLR